MNNHYLISMLLGTLSVHTLKITLCGLKPNPPGIYITDTEFFLWLLCLEKWMLKLTSEYILGELKK